MSLDSMRCQLRLKENKNLKNSKTGFKENRIHLTHAYTTHTNTKKGKKKMVQRFMAWQLLPMKEYTRR